MLDYRIYYADGTFYDGDPFNAPIFGVLVIVEKDKEQGRRLILGGDYYGWDGKRWFPYDFPGLFDYLQTNGAKRVLIGRLVSNEDFQKIYDLANTDSDFPIRTAYARATSNKVR